MKNIKAIIFDAYGTLFDVNSAAEKCKDKIGDKWEGFANYWRTTQLEYTWLRSLMKRHKDFWQVTEDSLDKSMKTYEIDSSMKNELLNLYKILSPFKEVPEVLKSLKDKNLKLAILSNGTPSLLNQLVKSNNLDNLFDDFINDFFGNINKNNTPLYNIFENDKEYKINNTEKLILEKMINNPGKTYSREDIGQLINLDKERSIDVIITRLRKKIEEIQNQFKENINISDEVIDYVAAECKTNIRELIGVLNRVIAFSRVHNKILTTSDCKNILKDVFSQTKIITVDKIQNIVSNYFNISLSEMLSQRRSRPLARPRQIAMYLSKKMTTRSLPEIGRRFANRDHTTVIHAVKTITRLSEQDDEMKKNISQIKSLLLEQ